MAGPSSAKKASVKRDRRSKSNKQEEDGAPGTSSQRASASSPQHPQEQQQQQQSEESPSPMARGRRRVRRGPSLSSSNKKTLPPTSPSGHSSSSRLRAHRTKHGPGTLEPHQSSPLPKLQASSSSSRLQGRARSASPSRMRSASKSKEADNHSRRASRHAKKKSATNPKKQGFSSSLTEQATPYLSKKSLDKVQEIKESIHVLRSRHRARSLSQKASRRRRPASNNLPNNNNNNSASPNSVQDGMAAALAAVPPTPSARTMGGGGMSVTSAQTMSTLTSAYSKTPRTSRRNNRLEALTIDDLGISYVSRRGENESSGLPVHLPISSNGSIASTELVSAEDLEASMATTISASLPPLSVFDLEQQVQAKEEELRLAVQEHLKTKEQIVLMQRQNWTLRKKVMHGNTHVPEDSVTTLNMKMEKLIRQEREANESIEALVEDKDKVDQECTVVTESIRRYQELLQELNEKIVPLLPPLSSPNLVQKQKVTLHDNDNDDDGSDSIHSMMDETIGSGMDQETLTIESFMASLSSMPTT